MRIIYLLPVIAFLFCVSCNPKLYPDYQQKEYKPEPLTNSPMPVILGVKDSIKIDGVLLGAVEYNQTMTSYIWDVETIEGYFKNVAIREGANLIKTTTYIKPSKHSQEKEAGLLYRVDNLSAYEKKIDWSPDRKLRMVDFKKIYDSNNMEISRKPSHSECAFYMTLHYRPFQKGIFTTKAQFNCRESWVNYQSIDSASLLRKEQAVFDLCEIHRRQLVNLLKTGHLNFFNQNRRSLAIYRRVYDSFLKKRELLESVFDHALDETEQNDWLNRIEKELKTDDGPHDPSLVIDRIPSYSQEECIAKNRALPKDSSMVYIFRRKGYGLPVLQRIIASPILLYPCPYFLFINPLKYQVTYNEFLIGALHNKHFLYQALKPGEYNFGYNHRTAWSRWPLDFCIQLEPGKTYYLQLNSNYRMNRVYLSPDFELLPESKGKKYLHQYHLSRNLEPGPIQLPQLKNVFE